MSSIDLGRSAMVVSQIDLVAVLGSIILIILIIIKVVKVIEREEIRDVLIPEKFLPQGGMPSAYLKP